MPKLRNFVLLSAVCAALAVPAFAGGSQGGGGGGQKSSVTLWDGTFNESNYPALKALWDAKYPDIELIVDYNPDQGMLDKWTLGMQTGNAGDVVCVQIDWANTFGNAGLLEPLDDRIKADGIDVSKYVPGAVRAATVNGKIYGLPYRCETYGLYYNKDMFKASGIAAPPKTWEEVIDYCKILTKDGNSGFGLTGTQYSNLTFNFVTILRSSGGEILTDDNKKARLDDKYGVYAANLYNELKKYAPSSYMENAFVENRNLFLNNKVAMYINSIAEIVEIDKGNPNCNYGVALMPTANGATRKTILGGWNVVIPVKGKNKDNAWKLFKFLTSPEVAAAYSTTFTGTAQISDKNKQLDKAKTDVLGEALQWAAAWPAVPQITAIRQEIYDEVQLILTEKVTPQQGMANATANINKLLAGN